MFEIQSEIYQDMYDKNHTTEKSLFANSVWANNYQSIRMHLQEF